MSMGKIGQRTYGEHVIICTLSQPRGVLLEIFGEGVPPGSLNPDPLSTKE